MRFYLLAVLLLLMTGAAFAQFNRCAPGFCFVSGGGAPPPLSNLRIIGTGDFRIINTGDNRAVFP